MKRIGGIYGSICDIENLRLAHHNARKDKSYYKEVKMVNKNEGYYLGIIHDMLINKTYKITKNDYTIQVIQDGVKPRELWKLEYYPHRIIQRAIMLKIEDSLNKNFCYHTCASIKGRGGKRVHDLMQQYLKDKKGTKYCLKIDITKFYSNVNHKILKQLLRKKFKDPDLLELLDMIIDSFPGKKGLPIGSYLSQFLANFYLSYFDHWLKQSVGCKYIIRYMDDIVVLGEKKGFLRIVFRRMRKYLKDKLNLSIKPNYQIFPTDIRGIDFVGYRYFHGYTLLRKSTAKALKQKCSYIYKKGKMNYKDRCSINSYSGWILYCDHYRLFTKYIESLFSMLCDYYYNNISQPHINRYSNKLMKKKY